MRFIFQFLFLLLFLVPTNPAQAQIKNECIVPEKDHLFFMEINPGSRALCVDARFLVGCEGPDNGKVSLVYTYRETDSLRGEHATTVAIASKTDNGIKLAQGRWATGRKKDKKGNYRLFFAVEGYQHGQYIHTAKAFVNGKKVEALRGGTVRKNTWLLDVSEEITRVLRDLRDPCQKR